MAPNLPDFHLILVVVLADNFPSALPLKKKKVIELKKNNYYQNKSVGRYAFNFCLFQFSLATESPVSVHDNSYLVQLNYHDRITKCKLEPFIYLTLLLFGSNVEDIFLPLVFLSFSCFSVQVVNFLASVFVSSLTSGRECILYINFGKRVEGAQK